MSTHFRTRKSIVESTRKLKILSIVAAPKSKSKIPIASPSIPRVFSPVVESSSHAAGPLKKITSGFSSVGRFTNSIFEKFSGTF
jgi:hypothetical protein